MNARYYATILFALGLVFISLTRATSGENAIPSSSPVYKDRENKAIQRATAYLNTIDWPTEGNKVAEVISFDKNGLPVEWEVRTESIRTRVNIDSNVIAFAKRAGVLGNITTDNINLKEETARTVGRLYLMAAGAHVSEAALIDNGTMSYTNEDGDTLWALQYWRVHDGFLFHRNDFIRLILDPKNGALLAYGDNFRSPLPESTTVTVNQETAEAQAKQLFENMGETVGKVVHAQLKIVQPDYYWQRNTGENVTAPERAFSRVAWVITYDAPWELTEVWIDAQSGDVLGGVKSRSRTNETPNIINIAPPKTQPRNEQPTPQHD